MLYLGDVETRHEDDEDDRSAGQTRPSMIQGLFPVLGNRNSLDAETVLILVYSEFKDFSTTKLIGPTESRTIGRPLISRLGILELPALSFDSSLDLPASRSPAGRIVCHNLHVDFHTCQRLPAKHYHHSGGSNLSIQKKRLACGALCCGHAGSIHCLKPVNIFPDIPMAGWSNVAHSPKK